MSLQNAEIWWILGVGIIVTVAFTVFLISTIAVSQRRFIQTLKDEMKEIKESKSKLPVNSDVFTNLSNISFHFADRQMIQRIYNDYFKDPLIQQEVSEITSETTGQTKASILEILGASLKGKDIRKKTSTIKPPEISTEEMFRRYQKETIRNNQVTLGLELVELDLSDRDSFEKLIDELTSIYHISPQDEELKVIRSQLKEKAVEKTLKRLEKATDWILLEGKFIITDFSPQFYKCIYEHSVNEFLNSDAEKITICFVLEKDKLEPYIVGNYAESVGTAIPLKVYGKVWKPIDRKSKMWEFQLSPLAVY